MESENALPQVHLLSNGMKLELTPTNPETMLHQFIDIFFKPLYQQSNDWIKTIRKSLSELENLCAQYRLSRGDLTESFLRQVESRLAADIADLSGTDKIEILFENITDLIDGIYEITKSDENPEAKRVKVMKLVENLNLIEIAELIIEITKD